MYFHLHEVGDGFVHGCWILHVQLCSGGRTSVRTRQKSHSEVRAAPGKLSEMCGQLQGRRTFVSTVAPIITSFRSFQRPRTNLPWFCLARTPPKTHLIRTDSTSTSQCTVNSGYQTLSFWRKSRIRFSLKVSRLIVSFISCLSSLLWYNLSTPNHNHNVRLFCTLLHKLFYELFICK